MITELQLELLVNVHVITELQLELLINGNHRVAIAAAGQCASLSRVRPSIGQERSPSDSGRRGAPLNLSE